MNNDQIFLTSGKIFTEIYSQELVPWREDLVFSSLFSITSWAKINPIRTSYFYYSHSFLDIFIFHNHQTSKPFCVLNWHATNFQTKALEYFNYPNFLLVWFPFSYLSFNYDPQKQSDIKTCTNSHCDICGNFVYNLKQTKIPKKIHNHNVLW